MTETLHVNPLPANAIRVADALMILHAFLQLLDAITTYLALGAGGHEANPVARAIIDGPGWWLFWVLKAFVAAAFIGCMPLMRRLGRPEGRMMLYSIAVFAAFMAFVVVNNALIAL